MSVTAEILNGVSKAVEGFFYVGAPILSVKGIPEFSPLVRISQFFTGSGKNQLLVLEKGLEACEELPFQLIPEDLHPDEEVFLHCPDLMVLGKPPAGNDAVHVHVVIKLLVPGVKDLYNAGRCSEMLFVSGKLQKCFRAASVEETVEEILVTVKERVQLMGKREDHVEVRGIDHFGPSFIDPDFFFDSLAVGAATVAAGVVVDFDMAALRTQAETVTEPAGLAV